MKLIGITGLIGSGKTTLGDILKSLGYVVYDMDVWCRKMYHHKDFLNLIKKEFPFCFENDVFDKRKLRESVFLRKDLLKKLENLTHPYLKQKFKQKINQHCFDDDIIFIQSALLFQMNLNKYCSKVILTIAPLNILKKRVIKRDKINENQFNNIISKQLYSDIYDADFFINTNQKLTTLKADVIKILKRIDQC